MSDTLDVDLRNSIEPLKCIISLEPYCVPSSSSYMTERSFTSTSINIFHLFPQCKRTPFSGWFVVFTRLKEGESSWHYWEEYDHGPIKRGPITLNLGTFLFCQVRI